MRLNTVGTGSGRLETQGGRVNCATLALAGVFLLAACGRSETDRESDRAANAANPAGLSPGKGGLSAIVTAGVVRRGVGRRKPRGRDRARHPAERRQRHRRRSRHVLCHLR
mgnify:CR=1 FL=1